MSRSVDRSPDTTSGLDATVELFSRGADAARDEVTDPPSDEGLRPPGPARLAPLIGRVVATGRAPLRMRPAMTPSRTIPSGLWLAAREAR